MPKAGKPLIGCSRPLIQYSLFTAIIRIVRLYSQFTTKECALPWLFCKMGIIFGLPSLIKILKGLPHEKKNITRCREIFS
jgi:hypothetical protein